MNPITLLPKNASPEDLRKLQKAVARFNRRIGNSESESIRDFARLAVNRRRERAQG